MFKNVFIPVLLLTFLFTGCQSAKTNEDNLDVQAFVEKMAATKEFNLVDVRTPEEFEKGHIENAQNIDLNAGDFDSKVSGLDKNKPVFLYCLTDTRSEAAAKKLRDNGYQVYMLKGGILKWRAENLPEVGNEKTVASGMTMEAFKELINTDKVVLVDFYADWCGPCKKMEPYLNEISKDMEGVKLVRIDTDENPVLTQQMGIQALPYLQIYKNNEKVWENLGFIEKDGVVQQLNKNL